MGFLERNVWAAIVSVLASSVFPIASVQAREPGVAPVMPPGATMGIPVAAPLPDGLYVNILTSYYDVQLKDNSGHFSGLDGTAIDPALQVIWVPGFELFGAKYKAYILQPTLYMTQTRSSPFPPPLRGDASTYTNANIQIQPIDLSWTLAPGLFFNAGFSVFAPTGQWGLNDPINAGANFWTFAPNFALTYLHDGWNYSLQGWYYANTENSVSRYRSGNEIMFDATITKDIGGINVGPVAYYYKQVSQDRNFGASYGGSVSGDAEKYAVGGAISARIGDVNVLMMYTHDVYIRNTVGGGKAWLTFSYKIF